MFEVADMYQREVEYEVKTLSSQIEPILIIFLGVLVLILALAYSCRCGISARRRCTDEYQDGGARIAERGFRIQDSGGCWSAPSAGFSQSSILSPESLKGFASSSDRGDHHRRGDDGLFLNRMLYYVEQAEKTRWKRWWA